ncbi:MAG: histidine phosphotransferase family protein [Alphaproteobacteria bacterium]
MDQTPRLIEMLCSRICHDLVSPIGAINNGVELLRELGEGGDQEAVNLIAHSAEQAAKRLTLMRLMYGAAGSDPVIGLKEVKKAAEEFFEGSRVAVEWNINTAPPDLDGKKGLSKVILNLIIFIAEVIALNGVVKIGNTPEGAIRIEGLSQSAALREHGIHIFNKDAKIAEMDTKLVHPLITANFVTHFGFHVGNIMIDGKHIRLDLNQFEKINAKVMSR